MGHHRFMALRTFNDVDGGQLLMGAAFVSPRSRNTLLRYRHNVSFSPRFFLFSNMALRSMEPRWFTVRIARPRMKHFPRMEWGDLPTCNVSERGHVSSSSFRSRKGFRFRRNAAGTPSFSCPWKISSHHSSSSVPRLPSGGPLEIPRHTCTPQTLLGRHNGDRAPDNLLCTKASWGLPRGVPAK